jgi:histidine triad (HIT) family protein
MECEFCQIIKRQSPASIVYEDEKVIAIIPLSPFTKGHTLIIPKLHTQSFLNVDKEMLTHMMHVAHEIGIGISRSEFCGEGINLWLSDGKEAGQTVMHVHLHIFPRYKGDEFFVKFHSKENTNQSSLNKMAKEISENLPNY